MIACTSGDFRIILSSLGAQAASFTADEFVL
jgi:hypothetical protein